MRIFIFLTSAILVYFNSFSTSSYDDFDSLKSYDGTYQETFYESDDKTFNQTSSSSEGENDLSQDDGTGHYTPDNNPVTWDENPDNFPLETPRTYTNVDNDEVQSPTYYREIPPGACAICGDGTFSFSKNRRGTCSRHGGVAEWLK